MKAFRSGLRELLRYPSAIVGGAIILLLVIMAIYALVTIPYNEAIRLWRGGEDVWYQNPQYAAPAWLNVFYREKQPVSFAVSTEDGEMAKTITVKSEDVSSIDISYAFDYSYDGYPQELILYFRGEYEQKLPFASVLWITPDGREIRIADTKLDHQDTLRFSQDQDLQKKLKTEDVIETLFSDPEAETPTVLKGQYQLVITGTTFEQGSDIDTDFVLHGKLFGLAGTDKYRRDLTLPLLWGTPVALAFGLLAALGTSVLTMIIAAIGTWYAGWVDDVIQRITEINLVLPFLAILIMVGTFYSRSIWVMLGVTVALGIFGATIKTYRAIFLQSKEDRGKA